MSKSAVIQKLEKQQMKKGIPDFRVGDTVRVHTRIIEGSKERVQIFTGTVIARKGCGISETFSVHRVAYGEGLERVFPLHSPRVAKIEVVKHGQVRRAKLYYLRGTSGKKAKVKSKIGAIRRTEEEILKLDEEDAVKTAEIEEVEEIADAEKAEEPAAESAAQS